MEYFRIFIPIVIIFFVILCIIIAFFYFRTKIINNVKSNNNNNNNNLNSNSDIISSENDTSNSYNICDIYTLMNNNLAITSSRERIIVTLKGKLVYDECDYGLNIILIRRSENMLKIEALFKYDTESSYNDIKLFTELLEQIGNNDIIVIIGKAYGFNLFKYNNSVITNATRAMKNIGGKICKFDEHTNYILITSKKGDIYYETASNEPVYFPNPNIISEECYNNPTTLYPKKDYIFYNKGAFIYDAKKSCAMEALIEGNYGFGIINNECVIISSKDYRDKIRAMNRNSKCNNGFGSRHTVSVYTFNKTGVNDKSIDKSKRDGIIFFNRNNLQGTRGLLGDGDYSKYFWNNILFSIKSFIVPDKYIVNVIDQFNRLYTITGPRIINNLREINKDVNRFTEFLVQKINPNSVVFCDDKNTQTNCFALTPGRHQLPPYLFLKINQIKLSAVTSRVILYNDITFSSVLMDIDRTNIPNQPNLKKTGETIFNIDNPKIVRAVEIL